MNLKILLPFQIFAEKAGVSRIVAEYVNEGSFGLLPHRLDCAAALTPGILIYESESDGEVFVAVDEGMYWSGDWSERARLRYAARWVERTSANSGRRSMGVFDLGP